MRKVVSDVSFELLTQTNIVYYINSIYYVSGKRGDLLVSIDRLIDFYFNLQFMAKLAFLVS